VTSTGSRRQSPEIDSLTRSGRERRQAILTAATEVIARHGFAGASLSQIAAAAGLEKGHITYYFRTKDDMLFEIIDDLHQRFLDGLDVWLAESDEEAALHHIVRSHVELVFELHKATRVSYENMRFLSRQRYDLAAEKRRTYELRLEAVIDAARSRSPIAEVPTTFLVTSILGMVSWPYQWYTPDGTETPDQVVELLAGRAIAMLRP
jgi:AcrR family transcriptional regulator